MAAQHIAIVGAGMAGITAARTLAQAGHQVMVFDKSSGAGGRMATRRSPFGGFDHGAQYFTVRDPRMALALQTVPDSLTHCRPWSANAVRVLRDQHERAMAAMNEMLSSTATDFQQTAQDMRLTAQQVVKDIDAARGDLMRALIEANGARAGRKVVDLRGVLVDRLEDRLGSRQCRDHRRSWKNKEQYRFRHL